MSFIVRNAICLDAVSIDSLWFMARTWQDSVAQLQKQRGARLVADMATGIFDATWLEAHGIKAQGSTFHDLDLNHIDPGPDSRGPISQAVSRLHERQKDVRRTSLRDPRGDLDFEFVLYLEMGTWYAAAFSEQEDWIPQWAQHFAGHEFDYWDNTDRPIHMTKSDWSNRAQTWRLILGNSVPAKRGFTVASKCDLIHPDVKDIIKAQPSHDTRATRLAMRQFRDATLTLDPGQTSSNMVRALNAHEDWRQSEAGAQAFAPFLEKALEDLKPHLDEADLTGAPS